MHAFVPALPTDVPLSQFNATIRKSSERPTSFFDLKDWVTWAYPALAVIGVIALVFILPYLAGKLEKLNNAMAETQRCSVEILNLGTAAGI
jgi:type IV secretory pathway ATPase VirB11/archaellum biosynthesis ATPase